MGNTSTHAKVFTIPQELSFTESLATGLLKISTNDPERLMNMRVFLPTRQSCRTLHASIINQANGRAIMLPHLIPLGDIDEEEDNLSIGDWQFSNLGTNGEALIIPEVSEIRRQLMLAKLVKARDPNIKTDQALRLALELAKLLDQMHTERIPFDRLDCLVPTELADHWAITLQFLRTLTHSWPKILSEEGVIDPAARRNYLLAALARNLRAQVPTPNVIAAGSTGSIPATADLLKVIAELPHGQVILPGLDYNLSEFEWQNLQVSHPQYGLMKLLERLEVNRSHVKEWPIKKNKVFHARPMILNIALSPAGFKGKNKNLSSVKIRNAMDRFKLVTCPTPRDEALVVALAMRRTLKTSNRTAALITPDRCLARRVVTELKRWNIDIEDSAGKPISQTSHGAYFRLIIEVASKKLAPIPLLALLKHPLTSGGMQQDKFRKLSRSFEMLILRGPRPAPGITGLKKALSLLKIKGEFEASEIEKFIILIEKVFVFLIALIEKPSIKFCDILQAHVNAAENLACTKIEKGKKRLWHGQIGIELLKFLSEVFDGGEDWVINPATYNSIFETLLARRVVRRKSNLNSQLFVWGLLEARLQRTDFVILGGLNEGTWPSGEHDNPWLSRSMMKTLGLPLPERRMGLTGHDFIQAASATDVLVTRAERVGGSPMIQSRWLARIKNLLKRYNCEDAIDPKDPWLEWAQALDQPNKQLSIEAPTPRPPVEFRPKKISATRIEILIKDPYAIYAEKILKLMPLGLIDANPGSMENGIFIHRVLEKFIYKYTENFPQNAEEELLNLGKNIFFKEIDRPGVHALWWPKFQRIAKWFIQNEYRRRNLGFSTVGTEVKGEMSFENEGQALTVTATADRIDYSEKFGYAVIDYKTGLIPGDKQVEAGLSPQLPIEAAILSKGGFKNLKEGEVAQMIFMKLSGGRQPGMERQVKLNISETTKKTIEGLHKLLNGYNNKDTPYRSQPRPMIQNRFSIYDHLARVKAWRSKG